MYREFPHNATPQQVTAALEEFQRAHIQREIAQLEMSKENTKAAVQALKNRLK